MNEELFIAVKQGDIRKFIELLSGKVHKANIFYTDAEGNNALHIAARNGKLKIVQYIVQHNPILINTKNNSHHTPLHLATEGGSKEIVSLLLENNADIDSQTKAGFNFFLFAFYGCDASLEMMDYLIALPDEIVSLKEKQIVVGDYHFETLYQKLKKAAGQESDLKKTQEKLKIAASKPREESAWQDEIVFERLYKTERDWQRTEVATGSKSYFRSFRATAEQDKNALQQEPSHKSKEKAELQQAMLMSKHSFVESARLSDSIFGKLKERKIQYFEEDDEGYLRAEEQIRRYLQKREDYSIKEEDYASIIVQAIIEEAERELEKKTAQELSQLKNVQNGEKSLLDEEESKTKQDSGMNGNKGSIRNLQLQHASRKKQEDLSDAPSETLDDGDWPVRHEVKKQAGKFS